MKTRQGPK